MDFFHNPKKASPLKRKFAETCFCLAAITTAIAPPHALRVGGGIFDISRDRWRCFQVDLEYQGRLAVTGLMQRYLELRPLIGIMATVRGSLYGYVGINFDLLFANHMLMAPGFAVGLYAKGDGKDLGYPLEFRSGLELAWQFVDHRRLGLHFYHLSNASLGKKNPGEESLEFYYELPLTKGFPFYRE